MATVHDSVIGIAEEILSHEGSPAPPSGPSAREKKISKLPPSPSGSQSVSPQDFYAYTSALSEKQWSRINAYVYRLIPAIRRKPSNIDKFAASIDEEYLLSRHGSGRYQLKLNDADGAGTIIKTIVQLDDPERPPKYNLNELEVKHPDNRQLVEELIREGKLTQDGIVIAPKAPENADATAAAALRDVAIEAMRGRQDKPGIEGQAFTKMMEMMANASSKSIEIAMGQIKKDGGDSPMMAMILQLMLKMMEMSEKRNGNGSDGGILQLMMKQIELAEKRAEAAEKRAEEERKSSEADKQRQHEKDMELLKQRANVADPLEMVEKVMTLQERLGGGKEDSRNWKEKLVDQGMEHVPEILSLAKTFVGRSGYGRPPQPMQQQPQSQTQGHTPAPAASRPSPAPAPTPSGEPMPPQQPVVTNIDPEIAWLSQVFESRGRDFVLAFAQDPDGGGDLADLIIKYAGLAFYERIARMGKEKILEAIACLPQMKTDLAGAGSSEMLGKFIDDFIDPPDDDEDEDDDADGPIIPEGDASRSVRKAKAAAVKG